MKNHVSRESRHVFCQISGPCPCYPVDMTKLTHLQENFCQGIVDGLNQSDSYKAAGYSFENMKPDTVYQAASRLASTVIRYALVGVRSVATSSTLRPHAPTSVLAHRGALVRCESQPVESRPVLCI